MQYGEGEGKDTTCEGQLDSSEGPLPLGSHYLMPGLVPGRLIERRVWGR